MATMQGLTELAAQYDSLKGLVDKAMGGSVVLRPDLAQPEGMAIHYGSTKSYGYEFRASGSRYLMISNGVQYNDPEAIPTNMRKAKSQFETWIKLVKNGDIQRALVSYAATEQLRKMRNAQGLPHF